MATQCQDGTFDTKPLNDIDDLQTTGEKDLFQENPTIDTVATQCQDDTFDTKPLNDIDDLQTTGEKDLFQENPTIDTVATLCQDDTFDTKPLNDIDDLRKTGEKDLFQENPTIDTVATQCQDDTFDTKPLNDIDDLQTTGEKDLFQENPTIDTVATQCQDDTFDTKPLNDIDDLRKTGGKDLFQENPTIDTVATQCQDDTFDTKPLNDIDDLQTTGEKDLFQENPTIDTVATLCQDDTFDTKPLNDIDDLRKTGEKGLRLTVKQASVYQPFFTEVDQSADFVGEKILANEHDLFQVVELIRINPNCNTVSFVGEVRTVLRSVNTFVGESVVLPSPRNNTCNTNSIFVITKDDWIIFLLPLSKEFLSHRNFNKEHILVTLFRFLQDFSANIVLCPDENTKKTWWPGPKNSFSGSSHDYVIFKIEEQVHTDLYFTDLFTNVKVLESDLESDFHTQLVLNENNSKFFLHVKYSVFEQGDLNKWKKKIPILINKLMRSAFQHRPSEIKSEINMFCLGNSDQLLWKVLPLHIEFVRKMERTMNDFSVLLYQNLQQDVFIGLTEKTTGWGPNRTTKYHYEFRRDQVLCDSLKSVTDKFSRLAIEKQIVRFLDEETSKFRFLLEKTSKELLKLLFDQYICQVADVFSQSLPSHTVSSKVVLSDVSGIMSSKYNNFKEHLSLKKDFGKCLEAFKDGLWSILEASCINTNTCGEICLTPCVVNIGQGNDGTYQSLNYATFTFRQKIDAGALMQWFTEASSSSPQQAIVSNCVEVVSCYPVNNGRYFVVHLSMKLSVIQHRLIVMSSSGVQKLMDIVALNFVLAVGEEKDILVIHIINNVTRTIFVVEVQNMRLKKEREQYYFEDVAGTIVSATLFLKRQRLLMLNNNGTVFDYNLRTKEMTKVQRKENSINGIKTHPLVPSSGRSTYNSVYSMTNEKFFILKTDQVVDVYDCNYKCLKSFSIEGDNIRGLKIFSDHMNVYLSIITQKSIFSYISVGLGSDVQLQMKQTGQKEVVMGNPIIDIIYASHLKYGPCAHFIGAPKKNSYYFLRNNSEISIDSSVQSYLETFAIDIYLTCVTPAEFLASENPSRSNSRTECLDFIMLSRVPLQIATIEGNNLVPLIDGIRQSVNHLSSSLSLAERADFLSFGHIEKILERKFNIQEFSDGKHNNNKRILVVSIVGNQSSGKSYLMNRLFGTRFSVAATRCTDGIWMSYARLSGDNDQFEHFIILDCEGLFSIRRNELEETKLLTVLAGISDITILNQDLNFSRHISRLFSDLNCAVDRVKGSKYFKGFLMVAMRDVVCEENEQTAKELKRNIEELNRSGEHHFLTKLFNKILVLQRLNNYSMTDAFLREISKLRLLMLNFDFTQYQLERCHWTNGSECIQNLKVLLLQLYSDDDQSCDVHMKKLKLINLEKEVLNAWGQIQKVGEKASNGQKYRVLVGNNAVEEIIFAHNQCLFDSGAEDHGYDVLVTGLRKAFRAISVEKIDRDNYNLLWINFNELLTQVVSDRIDCVVNYLNLVVDGLDKSFTSDEKKKVIATVDEKLRANSSNFSLCLEKCHECNLKCLERKGHKDANLEIKNAVQKQIDEAKANLETFKLDKMEVESSYESKIGELKAVLIDLDCQKVQLNAALANSEKYKLFCAKAHSLQVDLECNKQMLQKQQKAAAAVEKENFGERVLNCALYVSQNLQKLRMHLSNISTIPENQIMVAIKNENLRYFELVEIFFTKAGVDCIMWTKFDEFLNCDIVEQASKLVQNVDEENNTAQFQEIIKFSQLQLTNLDNVMTEVATAKSICVSNQSSLEQFDEQVIKLQEDISMREKELVNIKNHLHLAQSRVEDLERKKLEVVFRIQEVSRYLEGIENILIDRNDKMVSDQNISVENHETEFQTTGESGIFTETDISEIQFYMNCLIQYYHMIHPQAAISDMSLCKSTIGLELVMYKNFLQSCAVADDNEWSITYMKSGTVKANSPNREGLHSYDSVQCHEEYNETLSDQLRESLLQKYEKQQILEQKLEHKLPRLKKSGKEIQQLHRYSQLNNSSSGEICQSCGQSPLNMFNERINNNVSDCLQQKREEWLKMQELCKKLEIKLAVMKQSGKDSDEEDIVTDIEILEKKISDTYDSLSLLSSNIEQMEKELESNSSYHACTYCGLSISGCNTFTDVECSAVVKTTIDLLSSLSKMDSERLKLQGMLEQVQKELATIAESCTGFGRSNAFERSIPILHQNELQMVESIRKLTCDIDWHNTKLSNLLPANSNILNLLLQKFLGTLFEDAMLGQLANQIVDLEIELFKFHHHFSEYLSDSEYHQLYSQFPVFYPKLLSVEQQMTLTKKTKLAAEKTLKENALKQKTTIKKKKELKIEQYGVNAVDSFGLPVELKEIENERLKIKAVEDAIIVLQSGIKEIRNEITCIETQQMVIDQKAYYFTTRQGQYEKMREKLYAMKDAINTKQCSPNELKETLHAILERRSKVYDLLFSALYQAIPSRTLQQSEKIEVTEWSQLGPQQKFMEDHSSDKMTDEIRSQADEMAKLKEQLDILQSEKLQIEQESTLLANDSKLQDALARNSNLAAKYQTELNDALVKREDKVKNLKSEEVLIIIEGELKPMRAPLVDIITLTERQLEHAECIIEIKNLEAASLELSSKYDSVRHEMNQLEQMQLMKVQERIASCNAKLTNLENFHEVSKQYKEAQEQMKKLDNGLRCFCQTDHKCDKLCGICDDEKPCKHIAGHAVSQDGKVNPKEVHICIKEQHDCPSACEVPTCGKRCMYAVNHSNPSNHKCDSNHQCSRSCQFCMNTCSRSFAEEHNVHTCSEKRCPMKCILCGNLCCGPHDHDETTQVVYDIKIPVKIVKLHLCENQHQCPLNCAASGVCEVHYQEETRTYKNPECVQDYIFIKPVSQRKRCTVWLVAGETMHPELHNCGCDHKCDEMCRECGSFCKETIGHKGKHSTINHRNKEFCYCVTRLSDTAVTIHGEKRARIYHAGDTFIMETCAQQCKRKGRSHYHLVQCPGGVDCGAVKYVNGVKHCSVTERFYPDITKVYDKYLCEYFWSHCNWTMPLDDEKITLCNYFCPRKHSDGSEDKLVFCSFPAWHTDSDFAKNHRFDCDHDFSGEVLFPGLDICFCIDTTYSMQTYIDQCKVGIIKIVKETAKKLAAYHSPDAVLRFSVVGYRDHCDPAVVEQADFTNSAGAITFLSSLIAKGGGDIPEATLDGLDAASGLHWKETAMKILFHILDAPPHGKQFWTEKDDHPSGCPCGKKESVVLNKLKEQGIAYHVVPLTSNLNAMISVFEKYIPCIVKSLDDPLELGALISATVCSIVDDPELGAVD